MWINQAEIEDCKEIFMDDPVLGPATQFLYEYMVLVNTHSDGWPYWAFGTKPAWALMAIVHDANACYRRHLSRKLATLQQVAAACEPILLFMQSNTTFQGVTPPKLKTSVQLQLPL